MELEVKDMGVARGGRLVQAGLTFTCPAGQAVILRGPNGVGKTSLLRTLAGFTPAAGGDARLGDRRLSARDGFQEAVAYAGHLDAMKPQLSVAENLAFWSALDGGRTDTGSIFARLGIDRIGDRLVAACSAGQRRRAGLARLAISGRTLWLMDEPTVSLDTDGREALAGIIRDHLAGGGLALIATHDADLVAGAHTVTLTPLAATGSDDPFLTGEMA